MRDYRAISMWHDTVLDDDFMPRPSLSGPVDVDVCIVGAGYTGLWTAYYLMKADASLRVCVLEKEIAGYGASGRNGAWCSSYFASSLESLAKKSGREGAIAQQRAMFETVREVGRVCEIEDIEADYHRGGNLVFAMNPAQRLNIQSDLDYERSWGFGEEDYRWLAADEAIARIAVEGALGALYSPHCARVHPAKLIRGLAKVVERLGVPIYELTPALDRIPGGVQTPAGRVSADVVVRATEGYTVDLPKLRRALIPVYSLMIATEPLSEEVWSQLHWMGSECWNDGRNLIIYVSRTADGRIAVGGRGAPYHLGSRIQDSYERDPGIFDKLYGDLVRLLPCVEGAAVTHRWGGPIGIARDWCSSVGFDKQSGHAWAGAYVGDGVSTSNLAGRTLADLIRGEDSPLAQLPWVGHHSPSWEPEPLRWLGVNLALQAMASADRVERRTGRPSKRASLTKKLIS